MNHQSASSSSSSSRRTHHGVLKCSEGHNLYLYKVGDEGTINLTCDLCDFASISERYYGCRLCNFDICQACSRLATQRDLDKRGRNEPEPASNNNSKKKNWSARFKLRFELSDAEDEGEDEKAATAQEVVIEPSGREKPSTKESERGDDVIELSDSEEPNIPEPPKKQEVIELKDSDDEKETKAGLKRTPTRSAPAVNAASNDLADGNGDSGENRENILNRKRGPPLRESYSLEDKEEFMEALKSHNSPHVLLLARASKSLRRDKEAVVAACQRNGRSLEHASKKLRGDKEVVFAACRWDDSGFALRFASTQLRATKDVVLHASRYNGSALAYASSALRADKECVLAAVKDDGEALKFASLEQRRDREVVLAACQQDGEALQYASPELKADKECVIAAVKTTPEALKYALGGMNQDRECLIAAKLWDAEHTNSRQPTTQHGILTRITLSTRFSLCADSSPVATKFTVLLKQHPYIKEGTSAGQFQVYSPNAYTKGTCDPEWTRLEWPCRGTLETCQKVVTDNETGVPMAGCCWRYSFRYQLEQSRKTIGFMIQVVEKKNNSLEDNLGKGQLIELEMAKQLGVKVFRVHQPVANYKGEVMSINFQESDINEVVEKIKFWYRNAIHDMAAQDIPLVHFFMAGDPPTS